jgi:hypothetical protein
MDRKTLQAAVGGALTLAALMPALAQDAVPGAPQAQACTAPAEGESPLGDRQAKLSTYERMPEHCLKTLVMECTAVANQRMLDMGSAATCSMGYEALLKRGFGGDFKAMLAWWRTQRDVNPVN